MGIFSDEYANRSAIGNNFLLLLMYRFAYPFAAILSAAGISPNQITTMSILASIGAAIILVVDDGWLLFSILWGVALLLDFCDGTVARKTNTIRKTAFRYDHTSDLFKIFIVILAVGIRYEDHTVWILSLMASFLFMFFMVINHDLNSARQRNFQANPTANEQKYGLRTNWSEEKTPIKISKAIYAALMTINGHTLLIFLLFPFGVDWALAGLSYLAAISLIRSARSIFALKMIPK